MKDIVVSKVTLLETLKKNRDAHGAIFKEAVEGYRKQAELLLQQKLERIKSGKLLQVYISLPLPVNQTKSYDRAIGMLEMDVNPTVTLSETDYSNYVMDDWSWKREFLNSNKAYSVTAATMSPIEDED